MAFPTTDQAIAGVQLKLELPPGIQVCDMSLGFPRLAGVNLIGGLTTGLDVQFLPCLPSGPAVMLMHFAIWDNSAGHRDDLALHMVGASPDSLGQATQPKLKICDPNNPEGNLGLVLLTAQDAHINCTHDCDCVVAVEDRTWGDVKMLFRDR